MIHHQKSVVHKVPRVQKTLDTLTVQQQQQQYSITNPVNVDNVPSHASKSSFFKSQQAIPSITDAPAVVSTTQQPQNPINERHFNASIETGIPAGRADVFDTVEDLEEREESEKLGKPEVREEKAEKTETVEEEGGESGETGGSEKPGKLENQTRVIEESKGSEKPENQDVETVETEKSKESEKQEKQEKSETPKSNDEDTEETVETAVPKSSNETVLLTEIPTNSTALASNSMESAPSNSTTVSPGSNSLKPAKGASSKRKSSKQSRKGRNAKKSKRSSFIHSSNATNSTNSTNSTIGREIVDPLEPINLSEVSSLGFNYSLYYRDHSSLPIRIETPTTKWISGSSILQNYVNDVFLPRQMNSVARASNPIIYVARNDARLEQQMIGICDVFLLSLLYHRPFQCLPFPRGNDL